ncbi:unnamed protein product [Dicrocoelium dendriticum]|nr:unnamed protein product [Dicrocoelium dendriticum]
MMSINPHTLHSGTSTNLESAVSVSSDLISDRSIWRKITCIVLCLVFLINAWTVVILHVTNLSNETVLELTVSLVTLLTGQYIVTGIVDGYIYWKRWSRTTKKHYDKEQEQNKEAWVCMRTTFNLLGLAPISRYIEALVIIRRLVAVENRYLPEAILFVKEIQQPFTLPSGSLISAPAVGSRSSRSTRSNTNPPISAARINALDSGLVRIYNARRQFRRSERDASLIALTSGVAGAGPFVISQGVLYFRRVGLNYPMVANTTAGIFACTITGIVWLCAALTHFYPAALEQSEWDFDRGIGQIPIIGLVLLFSTHLVHVAIRTGSLVLFTAQFYWIVMGVLSFHFLLVLMSLLTARWCTGVDYSKPMKEKQSDVSANLLSDILFSFVGLFEFANAQAKYTRTRYLIFYFFYYLENAAMIGAWYVHFTYPGMWYYLPSLLVITIGQFLGLILLQVYLYIYSRAKRKTTLCGLCFARQEEEHYMPVDDETKSALDRGSLGRFDSEQTSRAFMDHAHATSMLSGHSGMSGGMVMKSHKGLYDPVFGQQITQAAIPKTKRHGARSKSRTMHMRPSENMSLVSNSRSNLTAMSKMNRQLTETETQRQPSFYKYHSRQRHEIPNTPDEADPAYHMDTVAISTTNRRPSSLLPISKEEAIEQEVSSQQREKYPSAPNELEQARHDRHMQRTKQRSSKVAEMGRNHYHPASEASRREQCSPSMDFKGQDRSHRGTSQR